MATGSYDGNGIWQYGEDDNIALFSDTLNKLADSTSDAFTSDRGRISTLEASSLAGIIPVVPNTITVATGTAAVNQTGVVSFTGATAISLNGVFTSSYKNYFIKYVQSAATVTDLVLCRLRTGVPGSDLATTSYYFNGIFANAGTVSGINTPSSTSWQITKTHSGASNAHSFADFTLTNPAVATPTAYISNSMNWSGTNGEQFRLGGFNTTIAAYESFTLYPATGNFTGTIQVFGYND